MRLKLGRPDIGAYQDYFTTSEAPAEAALTVTWMGVSTLLIDDGTTAIMTDGFFSRPGLLEVAFGRISPSRSRIDYCLSRAKVGRLAAVLPVHTHFDHALDSAVVAELTGARVVGGESAANIARGQGLSEDQILVVGSGEAHQFASFNVKQITSHHCPPDRYPGEIVEPVRPPARASAYRCGEAWSIFVHHATSDRRLLIQGSAGFRPQALRGQQAEIAYLGVGQLGMQPEQYIVDYWNETVRTIGARSVVLIHWDDFFRPLTEPMRALPFAGDDLDVTMRVLSRLADEDGVTLQLPTVWQRTDPWA
jgi:L-ascorbate metabolism protein UlaG (beta-lactamase superfamily)